MKLPICKKQKLKLRLYKWLLILPGVLRSGWFEQGVGVEALVGTSVVLTLDEALSLNDVVSLNEPLVSLEVVCGVSGGSSVWQMLTCKFTKSGWYELKISDITLKKYD